MHKNTMRRDKATVVTTTNQDMYRQVVGRIIAFIVMEMN